MKAIRPTHAARHGFSLVELMIVVAVIGVLAVISLRVIGGVMTAAREKATLATIKKIEGLLTQRVDAISHVNIQPATYAAIQRTGASAGLAKVLAHKDLLRLYCPQNFGEYNLPAPATVGVPNATSPTESAELLYHFLSNPSAGVPGYAPTGVDAFNTSEVGDTDADGLLEFIDGWGQPIRFYRWPTRLIRPLGVGNPPDRATASLLIFGLPPAPAAGTDPLNTDSDDPLGKASNATTGYATLAGAPNFESDYHTLNTYHTPLIVSAGEDGLLGLFEPSDIPNFGYLGQANTAIANALNDNITNLNKRAGGK